MMPKRASNGPAISFGFISVAVFVVSLILLCMGLLGVRGAVATAEPPRTMSLVLRRHQYGDYQQYHDDLLLGQGVGELRIQLVSRDKCYVMYGDNWGECSFREYQLKGGAATYIARPRSRNQTWTAYLRRPLNGGADGIAGYWAFCLKSNDDSWTASDWMMLNPDGTAVWGSGDYDAAMFDEQNLPPEGKSCTWQTLPYENGALVLLDLGDGYSAVELRL